MDDKDMKILNNTLNWMEKIPFFKIDMSKFYNNTARLFI